MWENYNFWRYDYNECSSKGNCSVAPNVSSLQEVVLTLIREIAYYLKRLKILNDTSNSTESIILYSLSEFVSVSEYTEEEILTIFKNLNQQLCKLRKKYAIACKKYGEQYCEYKNSLFLTGEETLSVLMSYGEKLYLQRINKLTNEEKFFYDLLLITLKSFATNILKISDYNKQIDSSNNLIINALNLYNLKKISIEKFKEQINEICVAENALLKIRTEIQQENFGDISKTKVSRSTKQGKAILVSGSSLIDLFNFLAYLREQEIENEIDVYTHGDLLIAHAFEKFKNFSQLKGHYGSGNENCLIDFATFPGTILLTKHSRQNLENIIRGRIYTMDEIQPKGALKIKNDEFTKVVESAKIARGFRKGQIRNDIEIGFNPNELNTIFENLKTQLNDKTFKRILIIGMPANSTLMDLYLQDLTKELSPCTFVINFSGLDIERANLNINIANNFPVMYKILTMLNSKIPISQYKYAFYLQKCNPNSISGIIQLKNMGAENIMLASCPPNVMNPFMLSNFSKYYGIKLITTPKQDVKILEK